MSEEAQLTIQLDQFLKITGLAETGGQAKVLVQGGKVTVNGEVDTRRGRKLKLGDEVSVDGKSATVAVEALNPAGRPSKEERAESKTAAANGETPKPERSWKPMGPKGKPKKPGAKSPKAAGADSKKETEAKPQKGPNNRKELREKRVKRDRRRPGEGKKSPGKPKADPVSAAGDASPGSPKKRIPFRRA